MASRSVRTVVAPALLVLALLLFLLFGCSGGTRPERPLRVSPDTLDFGVVLVGAADTLGLRVYNDELYEIHLRALASPPEFRFAGEGDTVALALSPGDSAALAVVFSPLSPGAKAARVRIEGHHSATVPCVGRAESDACGVTPAALDFGLVPKGSSRTRQLTLCNLGTLPLTGEVSLSCPEFEITEGAGPYTLEPGDSLRVVVTFRPEALGMKSCVLDLGATSCGTVPCTGTGSRVWTVKADGTGDAPTVQAAIDSASDGEMVLVGPGRYVENINLRGKAIHLKSEAGPEATILDGSGEDAPVVTCDSGEGNDTIIEGFTITGGRGWYPFGHLSAKLGGGISCLDAAPIIRGNIVTGNSAGWSDLDVDGRGGGISFGGPRKDLPPTLIEDNVIENNRASWNGGGINIGDACIIRNNTIRGNMTHKGDGGGIYLLFPHYDVLIRNNTIIENVAGDHGGGIYVAVDPVGTPGSVKVTGNVIVANTALASEGGFDCSGGGVWIAGGASVTGNTVAFNRAFGVDFPTGGGICLRGTVEGTVLERNLIYRNTQGGVEVDTRSHASLVHNLLFDNARGDMFIRTPETVHLDGNVFVDPLFCDTTETSLGELAAESPALHQSFGVIGAVDTPSCHRTPVQPQTWRGITRLYE